MALKFSAINKDIEKLSMDVMMIEPGDLIALDEVVSLTERLSKKVGKGDDIVLTSLSSTLAKLIQEIFKADEDKFRKIIEIFTNGLTLLQNDLNAVEKDNKRDSKSINDYIKDVKPFLSEDTDDDDDDDEEEEETGINLAEDQELFTSFVNESIEHMENVEASLLSLEQDPQLTQYIYTIFRAFHTIKGVAGFLKLEAIHRYTHEMESVLEHFVENKIVPNDMFFDFMFEQIDLMKKLIQNVSDNLEGNTDIFMEIDQEDIKNKIDKLLESTSQIERKKIGEIMVDDGHVDEESILTAVDKQKEIPEKMIGEILVEDGKVTPDKVALALKKQQEIEAQKDKVETFHQNFIKVHSMKLDNLLDIVGELVIIQSQIIQNEQIAAMANGKLQKDFAHLNRTTGELQKITMSLTMVEIKQTFQKLKRLVRDLSNKSGKKINLRIFGEMTEIDRNIVEEIYEPFVHLVRNAIDHGIENPEERVRAGKPEEGTLTLKAYHQGGNVVIDIIDDGKGLDKESILKKAINKGIVNEGEELDDESIYKLIFHSGLSTAKVVTNVSGRGVGMDIVRKKIEQLRGKIEIKTILKRGTTFTVKLPLTMAIIEGFIVLVGNNRYIIPTVNIRESFKIDKSNYSTIKGKGEMVRLRGNFIPLVRLHKLFNIKPLSDNLEDCTAILVESGAEHKCLLVDKIVNKQEVVVKSLGEKLKTVEGILGGTILGDGKVGLILDIYGVFRISESHLYVY